MNFHFTFGLPWFVGSCAETLFAVGAFLAALGWGVSALKRAVIAWRDRGTAPAARMLCREELLGAGLPILSLSDAKKVGQAKDVILDLASGRVAGFRVRSGPFTSGVLAFADVKAIGPDALTVASAASVRDARATPALLSLARERYRRTDCRVVTESGTELGQFSWRNLRFDPATGEAQMVLEVKSSSFTTYMIDLLFDVVSIFQPLGEWSINPWHVEVCLPLAAVLKVNRDLVIVRSQAEADCRAQQEAAVNRQHERLKNSREWFKLALARAWRRVTGRTP